MLLFHVLYLAISRFIELYFGRRETQRCTSHADELNNSEVTRSGTIVSVVQHMTCRDDFAIYTRVRFAFKLCPLNEEIARLERFMSEASCS